MVSTIYYRAIYHNSQYNDKSALTENTHHSLLKQATPQKIIGKKIERAIFFTSQGEHLKNFQICKPWLII